MQLSDQPETNLFALLDQKRVDEVEADLLDRILVFAVENDLSVEGEDLSSGNLKTVAEFIVLRACMSGQDVLELEQKILEPCFECAWEDNGIFKNVPILVLVIAMFSGKTRPTAQQVYKQVGHVGTFAIT